MFDVRVLPAALEVLLVERILDPQRRPPGRVALVAEPEVELAPAVDRGVLDVVRSAEHLRPVNVLGREEHLARIRRAAVGDDRGAADLRRERQVVAVAVAAGPELDDFSRVRDLGIEQRQPDRDVPVRIRAPSAGPTSSPWPRASPTFATSEEPVSK